MNKKELVDFFVDEYKEACGDYYEARYGEKINVKYTISNTVTGEIVNGTKSGCREDRAARAKMDTIYKLAKILFGDEAKKILDDIRKEVRTEEKEFFKENEYLVYYVTDLI